MHMVPKPIPNSDHQNQNPKTLLVLLLLSLIKTLPHCLHNLAHAFKIGIRLLLLDGGLRFLNTIKLVQDMDVGSVIPINGIDFLRETLKKKA